MALTPNPYQPILLPTSPRVRREKFTLLEIPCIGLFIVGAFVLMVGILCLAGFITERIAGDRRESLQLLALCLTCFGLGSSWMVGASFLGRKKFRIGAVLFAAGIMFIELYVLVAL